MRMTWSILSGCCGLIAMICLALPAQAANNPAEQAEIRIYTMADQGLLTLMVPRSWSDRQSELAALVTRLGHFGAAS